MKEYNSGSRQIQVKLKLELLRLQTFMRKKDINNVTDGLTQVVYLIKVLTPKCRP